MTPLFTREQPAPATEPVHAKVPELREAEISAVYFGQRQAGDFYDFIRVHPGRVLFGMLDAAGRLEETRPILTAAQETFRTLGLSLFAQDDVNEMEAMIELGLQLNRTVLEAARGVRACPAFAGCYNEQLGVVCYFNAGHTPGLVRDQTGVAQLPATGLPLGLFSHATSDATMVALAPGASLLLVSRGIVEARKRGEDFGLERVRENLRQTDGEGAKDICVSVLNSVRSFMGTAPTHNDVTVLALTRTPSI
jgi:sigma-B regulation protein RsbU (phosphoserine phosphatase)